MIFADSDTKVGNVMNYNHDMTFADSNTKVGNLNYNPNVEYLIVVCVVILPVSIVIWYIRKLLEEKKVPILSLHQAHIYSCVTYT